MNANIVWKMGVNVVLLATAVMSFSFVMTVNSVIVTTSTKMTMRMTTRRTMSMARRTRMRLRVTTTMMRTIRGPPSAPVRVEKVINLWRD